VIAGAREDDHGEQLLCRDAAGELTWTPRYQLPPQGWTWATVPLILTSLTHIPMGNNWFYIKGLHVFFNLSSSNKA